MNGQKMGLDKIQARLNEISQEMVQIIRQYGLTAQSPLEVIADARKNITETDDYIRFLELSLEGRVLGEIGDAMIKRNN